MSGILAATREPSLPISSSPTSASSGLSRYCMTTDTIKKVAWAALALLVVGIGVAMLYWSLEKGSSDFVFQKVDNKDQQREIPLLSPYDTVLFTGDRMVSAHGTGKLFDDCEIVKKLPIVKRAQRGDSGICAFYTQHGKAIIQQQATRGCTAAVNAMLITGTMANNLIHMN